MSINPYLFEAVETLPAKLVGGPTCDGNFECVFPLLSGTDLSFSVTDVATSTELEGSRYFFNQRSASTGKLMVSFPKEGIYEIHLFDSGHEDQRDLGEFLVMSSGASNIRFPKTYGVYGVEKGGILNSPLTNPLKKGETVFFSVQSNRSAVEVLIEDSETGEITWIPLEDKGNGVFEGSILIPLSSKGLEVDAKEEAGTSYDSLVEFELE